MNEKEFIEQVRARPGLFGLDGSYYPTATFLEGLDLGWSGRLLDGFSKWLVERTGEKSSLGWRALAIEEAFPGAEIRHWRSLDKEQQQHAVDVLFSLLLQFLQERDDA